MADTVSLTRDEAEDLVRAALAAAGTSPENADPVARALIGAEVDGQGGHGLSRVASYTAQARTGKVNGDAVPTLRRVAPAFISVDADNGFAYRALDMAISALAETAAETGIAAAAITRSHHCGQAGRHVEALAERGCVGLLFANTPKAMAPWGGDAPLFGTNPIAFAAPVPDQPPLVIDLSLSKVARGKIMAAGKRGETIPEGWALDASGAPTTDPKAALAGSMVPMGDAKGAALAMMVEILAVALTGANPSLTASSFFEAEGDPPGVGQLLIAVDAARVSGDGFRHAMQALAGQVAAQEGTRLPGSRRLANRKRAEAEGLTVPVAVIDEIRGLTRAS
ncbi:MAG: Ldh family oxidoreductase [Pseudomonadota bacterium]